MYLLFASRRRHTRWPRDWSSDVCSSDLCHYLKKETIPEIETLLAKVKKEYARVLKIHGIQYPWLKEAAPYVDQLTDKLQYLIYFEKMTFYPLVEIGRAHV